MVNRIFNVIYTFLPFFRKTPAISHADRRGPGIIKQDATPFFLPGSTLPCQIYYRYDNKPMTDAINVSSPTR